MIQAVGTFLAIDIGASALSSSQVGEDVVGNNISNASTPGYADEDPDFGYNAEQLPYQGEAGVINAIGSGVSVTSITRASDAFLADQLYTANGNESNASAQNNWLGEVQTAFNEPGNDTINSNLQTFFTNFTNIQNDSSSAGVLATAIQGGVTLAGMLQTASQQLSTTGQQISQSMDNDVSSINAFGQQLAQLNTSIQQSGSQSDPPNGLLDQQSQILTELSNVANISVSTNSNGTVNVSIGSTNLVQGITSNAVTVAGLEANGDVTSGDLGGLVQSQTALNGSMAQLNDLASQLITQVNALHEAGSASNGTTGLPFFTGTDASNIAVNQTLISNPTDLAISAAPVPPATTPAAGDTSNATAIGALATTTLGATAGPLAGQTFSSFYNQMVTQIGNSVAAATSNQTTTAATATQIGNQLDQITGVNQDTEMTNMMKYQNTYEAASKVVSTEDDMLQDLINDMLPTS
jgi:flagellar hook-associated protein 1